VEYPVVSIDREWRRLIPSKFPTIDVYDRLQSDELRAVAQQLEELTNPRLAAKARLTRGAACGDIDSPQLQNWNHAPFAYPNPEGTYFLGPAYRVMEVAGDGRAALAWAILRRETFMSRTNEPPAGLDMRMITNRIRADVVDLRGAPHDIDQAGRWEIGRHYYDRSAAGILFRHPEILGAEFLSVFDPAALAAKGVQATHYRFRWDGSRIPLIYDFDTGQDIKREDLFRPDKRVAA
jgi:hypothetical protein